MNGQRLLAFSRQGSLGLVLESSAPALVTAAFGRVRDLAVFRHVRGRARIASELECPFGRPVHRPPQQVVNVRQTQIPLIEHRLEQLLYAVRFIHHRKQRNCIVPPVRTTLAARTGTTVKDRVQSQPRALSPGRRRSGTRSPDPGWSH